MAQDVFIEKIVKRQKGLKDYLMIFGIVFLAFVVFGVGLMFPELFTMIGVPVLAGIIFLAYYLISGLNIEFEYIATNDEITIDKIIAKRKRKRVFTGSCKVFSVMGPISSRGFDSSKKNVTKILDFSVTPEAKGNWFFVTNMDGRSVMVVLEPDERMIQTFKRHNPRAIQA